MSVVTRTIIYSIYRITCDRCNRVALVSTEHNHFITDRRSAVRSIGWSFCRFDQIRCDNCRRYVKLGFIK